MRRADSIIKLRTPIYRDIYDATKARLQRERGAEGATEIDSANDPAFPSTTSGTDADRSHEIEMIRGVLPPTTQAQPVELEHEIVSTTGELRPYQIHGIARKVAVKAFVGDLLREMKAAVR